MHSHYVDTQKFLHVLKQCELLAALQGTIASSLNLTSCINVQGLHWGVLSMWAS